MTTNDTFTVTRPVPLEIIRGLLCCAFEGGSNYWYGDLDIDSYPTGIDKKDDRLEFWHTSIPTYPGGKISFIDIEEMPGEEGSGHEYVEGWGRVERRDLRHTLTLERLILGAQALAEKFPRHWANALSQNDDAYTGDAYLQCCVFGDVIY